MVETMMLKHWSLAHPDHENRGKSDQRHTIDENTDTQDRTFGIFPG